MGQKAKALKVPAVLCNLGLVVELKIDATNNTETWMFRKSKFFRSGESRMQAMPVVGVWQLFSTPNGKKLFVLLIPKQKDDKKQTQTLIKKHQAAVGKGLSLYSKWHECDAAAGSSYTPPRGFLWPVGRVISIVYRSDKWTGKNKLYIHKFKKQPKIWANNKTVPKVIEISGRKISVQNEGITG